MMIRQSTYNQNFEKIAANDTQNVGKNLQKICSKICHERAKLPQILRNPTGWTV